MRDRTRIAALLMLLAPLVFLAQEPEPYPASRHGGSYMFSYYMPPPPGSTPWAPCWSPDGKWIAVAMQGSIWKVDPKTGIADELTSGGGYASSPAWSPDGRWIAYTADEDARRIQLAILNTATGESRALTDDNHVYLDPAFSPDGTRLAYVSTEPNGYFNIYIRAIRDGRWDGPPAAVTTDNEYPRERLYFGRWDMHTQPAWTPDGKELVFVSNRNVSLGSGDLWRAPAKEGGMREGRVILHEQTLYRTRPHVSPEGRRILYASFAGGADQFNNLYLLPIDGGAPYKLTFGSYDRFHPRWSPDGEWIAFISNENGLPQLCLLEARGGAMKRVAITALRWRRPMGRLRLRAVDATGKPTPVRIHGLAADGRFYSPADSYVRIGTLGRPNFYSPGESAWEIPPGVMTVEAVKGFEYAPARKEVQIQAGRTATVTVLLRRLANLPSKGWFSGSTHVHMNYGGNLRDTPELLAAQAAGEDLRVVNALVANKDNRVLDWQYFRPGAHEYPLRNPELGIHVQFGEEYRPAFWGHSFLLGLKEHLISPFPGNYEATAIDTLIPTNADIFRKAKAQGAITGYVHPLGDGDPVETNSGPPAIPVDAVLGVLDALEWSGPVRGEMPVWHRLLNNDVVLVPVGGEDSINDLVRLRTLGAIRTYVHLNGELTAASWLDGLRKGHTFFTTGPLLSLTIDGKIPGDVLRLPAGGGAVTIEASVQSAGPLSKVTLYDRTGAFREIPLDAASHAASFREQVHITGSDWFSLAAEGPRYSPFDVPTALAATNAVRIYVGRQKIRDRASAEYFLRWIENARGRIEQWPWWGSPAEKDYIFAQFDQAKRIYERFIEEAR